MSELLVIGEGAEAVAEAVGLAGAVLTGPQTPLIAAAHEGDPIDPEALLAEARDAEVAVVPASFAAPLTPRYAVRDLAAALGAPVVLAVPAAPGLTGPARLTAEAVRGFGLAVAAIVLTGWPDPPGRALLDERALLHEVTDLPVLTLSPGEEPDWPVEDWAAAVPAGAGAADGGRATPRVALEPYRAWDGDVPGDPRATARPRIMEAIAEIVAVEGPMLSSRAYALYNKASGGKKLTSVARAPLSSAAYWLAQQGGLEIVRTEEAPWQGEDVLRVPGTPPVVVRELGPRELVEVPLDEIAELMRRLGEVPDRRRAVLDTYGLKRMTARAEEYLGTAEGLLSA